MNMNNKKFLEYCQWLFPWEQCHAVPYYRTLFSSE